VRTSAAVWLTSFFLLLPPAWAGAYSVKLVAGSDWVGDGGPATEAILLQAEGLAIHPNGALYIADAQTHRVRAVSRDGVIQTVAGNGTAGFSGDGGLATAAQLHAPYGIAIDAAGNLYIADLGNARVRRVSPDGIIQTIAGGAPLALDSPRGIALDPAGGLYIADFGANLVYYLDPAGSLETMDTHEALDHPAALALGGDGALYVADSGNHRVLKVTAQGTQAVAQVAAPTGLAVDAGGALYVADAFGAQILRLPESGAPTFLAGSGRAVAVGADGGVYASDGQQVRRYFSGGGSAMAAGGGNRAYGDGGPAIQARLNRPAGLALDRDGNLYIADEGNHRVRRVARDGVISTVAGTGAAGYSGNGGAGVLAALNAPAALSTDFADNLYIVDRGNGRLRLLTPFGVIFTLAMIPDVRAVTADEPGHIYVAAGSQIVNLVPPGVAQPVLAGLTNPEALAVDAEGALYFIDDAGRGLGRRAPDGTFTYLRYEEQALSGIVATPGGVFTVSRSTAQVLAVDADLRLTAVELDVSIGYPSAIAAGRDGTLYVADAAADRVWALRYVPAEVVHAATGVAGPLAPGMLATIRGMKLHAPEVRIGGVPAAVLAVRGIETTVEVAPSIAGREEVAVEIRDGDGVLRASFTAPVSDAVPGLFTDPSGYALALNEDGSRNSPENWAGRGSIIVLYGTGQGVGALPLTVEIGGAPAEVLYSGPVAGYPGLWQINARISSQLAVIGAVGVTVQVGNAVSPTVAIAAQ
jgi:uncharacterized protein (TIGR03437 family)